MTINCKICQITYTEYLYWENEKINYGFAFANIALKIRQAHSEQNKFAQLRILLFQLIQ